jgi:hypothetical protein
MPESDAPRSVLMDVLKDPVCRGLILLGMVLHGLLAFAFHLSPDETHYALYAINPDWSYFDHPPMAGWLQWPFANMLGGSDVVMRFVPMLCWALATWWMAALTQLLYPNRIFVSRAAVGLWLLAPVPHLLGLALVPDTLLMPLICAVMYFCWCLCDAAQVRRAGLWLGLGVCLGLAGLTKYTAIFIGLGAALALLLAHGPRLLALPGTWLAVLVAALLITPVIAWNASHQWISLAYQTGHAAGSQDWLPRRVAAFVLVQLLGYGLLLLVGIFTARKLAVGDLPNSAVADSSVSNISPWLFCGCFGLPPLLLVVYLSGRGSTLPHWSISAWLAWVPAAAAGCLALWQSRAKGHYKWVLGLGIFQAMACIGLMVLMLSAGTSSERGDQATSQPGKVPASAQFNPFADLYGWPDAARRAKELAQQNGNATLAVMSWTLDSRIAWYAQSPVKVVQRHLDQFGLWWGVLQPGENALLVDWSQMSFAPPVSAAEFERCELLEQMPTMRWGRQIAHFNFQICHNWQGPKESALDRREIPIAGRETPMVRGEAKN